jgi:uncharacterized membrane protein (UPF0127 family)
MANASYTRAKTRAVLGLAAMVLCGSAQAVHAAPPATPPATTSSECPAPAADTGRFLDARAFTVQTPRGALSLVPVTDEPSRQRGLMCVVRIPPGRGMIFVFPPPQREQNFWMKNTLVPLDMVFVGSDGVVRDVAADVPATPRGTADGDVARREGLGEYVIELGAGVAAGLGIERGTKLALPTLSARP